MEDFRSPFLNFPCSLTCSPPAAVFQPSGPAEQPLGVERAAPGSGEWEPHPLVEEENTPWSAQWGKQFALRATLQPRPRFPVCLYQPYNLKDVT